MRNKNISITILFMAILIIAAFSCKKKSFVNQKGRKTLLIMADGLSPEILNSLIKKNKIPNIKGLIDEGSYGILESEKPFISPALFCTISTGKSRSVHGIDNFLQRNDELIVPNLSSHVRAKTLWDIFNENNRSVGVIGHFATAPAKSVNGYIVSDMFPYYLIMKEKNLKSLKYFKDALELFKDYFYYPESIKPVLFSNFPDKNKRLNIMKEIGISPDFDFSLFAMNLNSIKESIRVESGQKKLDPKKMLMFEFYYSLITQKDMKEVFFGVNHYIYTISMKLIKKFNPDLSIIYFSYTDFIVHDNNNKPENKDEIENTYIDFDKKVAELAGLMPANSNIIIVSDHGTIPEISTKKAFGKHTKEGTIIISGAGIKKGQRINANIYQVAPLILYLNGFPLAKDMKGKLLKEAISDDTLNKMPVRYIETYE